MARPKRCTPTVANPDAPNLGLGDAREETLSRRQCILSDVEHPGVHINGNALPVVTGFDVWTELVFLEVMPALRMLLSGRHRRDGHGLAEALTEDPQTFTGLENDVGSENVSGELTPEE